MTHYAHTHPEFPNDPSQWQKVEDHLRNVAKLASEFAAGFDSGEWGYLVALWHDLGKP